MKKGKVLLILTVILLGIWFISSVKELHFLMQKYPTAFHQSEGFSFTRFYNTYDTLSFSEVMIQKGRTSSYHCSYLRFDEDEKKKLATILKEDYLKNPNTGTVNYLDYEITQFRHLGANCLAEAKLIDFKTKDNRAYATFSCERENLVQEFTYSSSNDGICSVVQYKKEWGIEPKRTLEELINIDDSFF